MGVVPDYKIPPGAQNQEGSYRAPYLAEIPPFSSTNAYGAIHVQYPDDEADTSDAENDDEQASNDDIGRDESGVQEPLVDIRSNLERALGGGLDFNGDFHFEKSCTNAPNPTLRLDNFGYIGLPLNPAEAMRMIAYLRPTPSESAARGAWEIDASKVHFDNPDWNTYIAAVASEVCKGLGVDLLATRVHLKLHRLLLYEKGSHVLPNQITEHVYGTFATMLVSLPTQFTGGDVYLLHAGETAVIDCSPRSVSTSSVFSWYTNVTHQIEPIRSGYRLALSYSLIHTNNTPRPSLPDLDCSVAALRHVLQSWQHNINDSPEKIIYLLEHQYSPTSLRRGDAFKGRDARRVELLQPLADELGFQLGLATAECTQNGLAKGKGIDPDRDYKRNNSRGWDESLCNIDPAKLDFADEIDREISIKSLFDLKGGVVGKGPQALG